MDMTQLFAAFPQLSMMGGPQQMQTGTPQMNGGMNFQQLNTDPNAAANLQVDAIKLQQNRMMAQALMQQGGQYIPGSGKAGIAAGLASLIRGKMMESGQDESLRDILQRQFKMDNEAAAAKRQRELEDEDRKLRNEIFKGREGERAKLDFAGKQYAAGLGTFDPRTGELSIDPNISASKLAEKEAELRLGAKYRQGAADPFANIKNAVSQGLITPEEAQKRMRDVVLGLSEKGASAPAGYRPSADGSSLEAIPGGPADTTKPRQVPADMAGKVALADEYVQNFPQIEQVIKSGDLTGIYDLGKAEFGRGKGGETYRQIQAGRDALQRTLTGAGMPASEADEYTKRYLPTVGDNQETLLSKQKQLKHELENFTNIARGTTNSATPAASSASGSKVINGVTYVNVGGQWFKQ